MYYLRKNFKIPYVLDGRCRILYTVRTHTAIIIIRHTCAEKTRMAVILGRVYVQTTW